MNIYKIYSDRSEARHKAIGVRGRYNAAIYSSREPRWPQEINIWGLSQGSYVAGSTFYPLFLSSKACPTIGIFDCAAVGSWWWRAVGGHARTAASMGIGMLNARSRRRRCRRQYGPRRLSRRRRRQRRRPTGMLHDGGVGEGRVGGPPNRHGCSCAQADRSEELSLSLINTCGCGCDWDGAHVILSPNKRKQAQRFSLFAFSGVGLLLAVAKTPD